jgi:hypothetical protein
MICYCHDIAETLLNNILLMTFDEVVVRFINPTNYIYRYILAITNLIKWKVIFTLISMVNVSTTALDKVYSQNLYWSV